jgi:hypothetical protein
MTGTDIVLVLATAGEMLRRALINGTPAAAIHAVIAELRAAKAGAGEVAAVEAAAVEAER